MRASNPPSAHSRFSCLLMDDDVGFSGMLAKLVSEEGGDPCLRHSVKDAKEAVDGRGFDLAILDNRLPDGTGFEFYAHLRRRCPDAVVVMITGAPELAQAVELTRNGLFDYLTKPIPAEEFVGCLRRAKLRLSRPDDDGPSVMAGESPATTAVLHHLRQAARHPGATVLLLGETGTGKDLAARVLHQLTFGESAAQTPFVALNCPAVPSEMFEAELFGSEKGAYTGADRRRTGLVEAAGTGTLFLDEVAEIPLALQAKLLRFLENREYRPLGSTTTRHFRGRIVAATNRDLVVETQAGRFREDLLFRLDVMSVHLPPLRQRASDIPALAESLLTQLATKYERRRPTLRPHDLTTLSAHHFPGNVRELRNLLERSLLKTPDESLWLNVDLAWLQSRRPAAVADLPTGAPTPPVSQAPATAATATPPPAESPTPFPPPKDRQLSPIEAQEYQLVAQALRDENGGIRRAASRLGLTHQALLRRLQKWPELRQAAVDPTSSP